MGIGWIQGIQQACVIFQTAILLAAAVGVCMLALGMGRKKELPFVPFLLAGYLVQYI
jgi:prepilin signal peptidase PulO-like enzyme (type II secretory pathway)